MTKFMPARADRAVAPTRHLSLSARLAECASTTALAAALVMPGVAFAQATTPNANPTAKAQVEATTSQADPTPQPATPAVPAPAEPQAEADQSIVVTGIRAGLESSAKIKRQSVLIVD